MLLPLVPMLLPFFKLMPPIYGWRMASRIYRWYDDLERLEDDLASGSVDRAALAQELERIEKQVRQVSVPASYADRLYQLRQHIGLVRRRIAEET